MTDSAAISLDDQVACVARELALRKRVYAKWVSANTMSAAAAELEIARMAAVLETLTSLVQAPDELEV